MSSPVPPQTDLDQSIPVDALVAELGRQVGALSVEIVKLKLLLGARDEQVRLLRGQLVEAQEKAHA